VVAADLNCSGFCLLLDWNKLRKFICRAGLRGSEMTRTALTSLQDQIELIWREAYAAGYQAAMQATRDFAAKPLTSIAPAHRRRGPETARKATATTGRRQRSSATLSKSRERPQRGSNAQLVAETLKAMAKAAARPAEIRRALQREKGVTLPFTSIRHALGQLADRNEVETMPDGKTWRYRAGGSRG
jgi:hypothetical protein